MDFADSTLVVLSEELGTNRVFTTDHRDFSVYRIVGRGHFVIEPPPVTNLEPEEVAHSTAPSSPGPRSGEACGRLARRLLQQGFHYRRI